MYIVFARNSIYQYAQIIIAIIREFVLMANRCRNQQDAREVMRVVFFCTHKMYLYAQNEISYEYIQMLF